MKRQSHEYRGEFDAIVLMVGANDLGQFAIRRAIDLIKDTVDLLVDLNPGAPTFVCEVNS